jgi:DNA modification methylase
MKNKDFTKTLPQDVLNIEEKNRSNLFAWRGQFSPQLIECMLDAYCPTDSIVLDPFAGSGTVLYEATLQSFQAYGYEINPSAWSFCKIYEFANYTYEERESVIKELQEEIKKEFPVIIFNNEILSPDVVEEKVIRISQSIGEPAKIIFNALVVLLDIYNNKITNDFIHIKLIDLIKLIREIPFTEKKIKADLRDSRSLPLQNDVIDFIITSPPYINVFNYHQNYRRSVEILGWNSLRVAKSEIGSNRANRGNRFYTVVQYCIDMSRAIQEMSRVLKPNGRAVVIVGHESRVLGTPFNNALLIEQIAIKSGLFDVVLRQKRVFLNRFGKLIREDILNLLKLFYIPDNSLSHRIGKSVALNALKNASSSVPVKNKEYLEEATQKIHKIDGTPIFNSNGYTEYYTREKVMMVSEKGESFMTKIVSQLPTPHLYKLNALINNPRLPAADKPRVQEAFERYDTWIREMKAIKPGLKNTVQHLVDSTNNYKRFIELDLIFDSPENFLYRQKGQLKLDNTILEEFLPQLVCRALNLPDGMYEIGPRNTFAGLSFSSSLSNQGYGGHPILRKKDQDFILGKRLYITTSFDKNSEKCETVESHLGYVCAECKTNLDKTMFQEAVATSRDLKIAVPSSLYFLICEFLDMTPISITSTQIDDVLIVRKAKRMSSNVRQEYRTAKARKERRNEYVEFIDSAKYYADVFQRMIDKIKTVIDDTDPHAGNVLKQGYF